jgi:hypothetical protein
MQSSPHKNYVEELFEKMSNSVGNSIDFAPRYELVNGKAIARCQVLNSVDIVDSPAATKSLFEEKPEPSQYMALSPEDFDKIAEIVKAQVAACMEAAKPQEAPQELAEEAKPEEKPEEAPKEEMACEDEKMSALVEKATLSAVQKLFPKAALTNLNAAPAVVDEYSEKLNACLSAGMSEAHAILHIARKFPKVHNQKFSQGVTQTNAKL